MPTVCKPIPISATFLRQYSKDHFILLNTIFQMHIYCLSPAAAELGEQRESRIPKNVTAQWEILRW